MAMNAARRGLFVLAMLLLGASATPGAAVAADAPLVPKTVVFKTVGDTKIEADVYRADDQVARPVLVWLHGGALIVGNRRGVPNQLVELCRKEGYVLVSLDYRLAPEVKLPEIIEDVKDGFRWIHNEGAKQFHMDTRKVVVSGGSAGGYLTMMTGICIEPRPTALLAYWGYGDVDGDWLSKPSEHKRKSSEGLIPEEEARKAVGAKVLTGTEGAEGKSRGRYYLFLRQNGLWTREVTGFDPSTERKKIDPYCPVRNITSSYPPILMIHGTNDTDVPYSLSADMATVLSQHNRHFEFITVPDAEHGLAGGDKQFIADANARALVFVQMYLK